jgi:hypothetical protein
VTGKGDTLTLDVFADDPTDPTIAILNPEDRQQPLRAVVSLRVNSHIRGFFVEKNDAEPGKGTIIWFPARKQRATKRAAKKA